MNKHVTTAIIGAVVMIGGIVVSLKAFTCGMHGAWQLEGFIAFMLGGCALIKGAGDAIVLWDERRHSQNLKHRKSAHVANRMRLF